MQKIAERKPAKKIEEEMATIRMVPRKAKTAKMEKPPKDAGKLVGFEGSTLIFEGKTAENRITEIRYWGERSAQLSFQIKFSGQPEDFSTDPQKLLDMLTDYIHTDEGMRNCRALYVGGAVYLYKKLGAEGTYELPKGMYDEIERRIKSIDIVSDKSMEGYDGLSKSVEQEEKIGTKHSILYSLGGIVAGVLTAVLTFEKDLRVAGAIFLAIPGALLGGALAPELEIRELKMRRLDATPHEITHAISNNRRTRVNSHEHHESKFEEGMTSLLIGDWVYKDYQDSITNFVKSLPKKDRKPALDIMMKAYLNVELDAREEKWYQSALKRMF